MEKRKIQSGHVYTKDEKDVEGEFVRFIAPDGRCQFEVRIHESNAIEVRAVDWYKDGELIMGTQISVEPRASNQVIIRSIQFEE